VQVRRRRSTALGLPDINGNRRGRPDLAGTAQAKEEASVSSDAKKIVLGFIDNLNARNRAALGALSDRLTWSMMKRGAPSVGKAEIAHGFETITDKFESMRLEPIGVTAEGNRVAVEVQGHGKARNGKEYNNIYHFLFVVEDGQIVTVKEFMDTQYYMDTFGGA
jgi:ketosteroid isomerase-like protein